MEKSLINGGFNGNIIYKWVIYSIAMLNNQRVYIIMIYNILTTMVGGFKGALSENGVPQYWPRVYPCLSSFSHYINGIIYIYIYIWLISGYTILYRIPDSRQTHTWRCKKNLFPLKIRFDEKSFGKPSNVHAESNIPTFSKLDTITLWLFNIAMENGTIYRWFMMIYLLKVVISHSYG